MRRLFEGGAYLKIVPDEFAPVFLYFYSTVHFLSVNFPMDWNLTGGKSRIAREIRAVKKIESFMITRAKISAVRANSFVVVEQFSVFPG